MMNYMLNLIKKEKKKDESFDELLLRVVLIYDRFCESDKPSISKFVTLFSCLFSFPEEEHSLMSNEKDLSYQEYPPLEFIISSCHEQGNQE